MESLVSKVKKGVRAARDASSQDARLHTPPAPLPRPSAGGPTTASTSARSTATEHHTAHPRAPRVLAARGTGRRAGARGRGADGVAGQRVQMVAERQDIRRRRRVAAGARAPKYMRVRNGWRSACCALSRRSSAVHSANSRGGRIPAKRSGLSRGVCAKRIRVAAHARLAPRGATHCATAERVVALDWKLPAEHLCVVEPYPGRVLPAGSVLQIRRAPTSPKGGEVKVYGIYEWHHGPAGTGVVHATSRGLRVTGRERQGRKA